MLICFRDIAKHENLVFVKLFVHSVNILILLLCFSVDGRKIVHFSHPFRWNN